ncbi:Zn-dependent exopeptidase [Myriangium duriaei CBS 260.36]|uniref:Peptide hydrolase n=1 Tax=Myriangium duriaei CBS 260.36 TaxID=1168546 RepID=A0A9P4J5G9_9PEZI|nr:Zn-dependent exopeptidase [Myriangium duriaei CBS 260.36]
MKVIQPLTVLALVEACAASYYGPWVDSRRLQADIKESALLHRSQKLQDIANSSPGHNRVFGSVGHNATTKYIYDSIASLGDYYTVEYQYFVETFSGGNVTLSVDDSPVAASLFTYAPNGRVEGTAVVVKNLGCNATDFPTNVAGSVALISRGSCEFGLKAALAGAAGASGALIYNNVNGSLAGTLGSVSRPEGKYPPVAGLSLEDGQHLVALAAAGSVKIDLHVNSIQENRTTQNVIAQTKCGDQNNVVTLGGHSDSVEAGPGINDDGSGTVGILEVATQLAKYRVKNAVRFIWWSAEEFGLLGSKHYVQSLSEAERAKIRLYLNFDMIASPNYFYGVYDGDGSSFNLTGPPGSAQIEKTFEAFFKSKRLPYQGTEFSGRSDYGPFLDAGIPAGGLFTGAEKIKTEAEAKLYGGTAGVAYDKNYHAAGDTIDNLAHDAFVVNTRGIADAVAKYALCLDEIPRHNGTVATGGHAKRAPATKLTRGCFHDHEEPVSI